jgi:hypothetical protein
MPTDYNYRPRPSASPNAADFTVERAAALITRYQAVRQPKLFDGRCPYVGPVPFQEQDARLYFGHENALETLLDRLERETFVCITGPESVGKTSLIQAGLVFALRNGAILDSDKWLIHTFTPGDSPIQSLADATAALGQRAGLAAMVTDAVRKRGLTGPNALHNFADMLLGPDPKRRVVLIVDQFEEVFTKAKSEDDQRAFINFVTQVANEPPSRLILIIALRSEFLLQAAGYPAFQKLVGARGLALQPMEANELARAIVLPALETGTHIEPALLARLINDVQGDPSMLPKLQMSLRDLFMALPHKAGKQKALTLADYIDFGPIRERESDHPPVVESATGSAAATQPLRQSLGDARAVSHFAQQEAQLKRMRVTTAVAAALGVLALAFGAFGLIQQSQANQRAEAAATAQAIAQADATRAVQTASLADVARGTAEAQATQAAAERESAIATRAVAEAAATEAVQDRAAALTNEATAIALATSVVNREQNAVQMEATISAVATESGAQVLAAQSAKATADANLVSTRARELTAIALNQLPTDPQLALLIAIEADKLLPSAQSQDAIRRAFAAAFPNDGAFRHPAAVTDARVSSDGKRLLTASRDGLARLWDIASGEVITTYRGHVGQVTSASFSPDGTQILTTSTDRTARVWNLDSGRVITVLVGHTGVVNDAAYVPDGLLAVTGGADRTARVWDLATGKAMTAPIQATGVVSVVAFLDENQVGVRTADSAQRFDARTGADAGAWEIGGFPVVTRLADGTLSVQPDGGGGPINLYGHTRPAAISDDVSGMIVTVSADGTARVHRFRLDELVGRAQQLLGRELTCDERVRLLSETIDCAAPATPTPTK